MKTGGCGCVARPRAPAAVEVIADRAGLDRALAELEARRDDAVRAVLGLPAKLQRRSRAASKRWRAALPSRLRTRGRRGPAPVREHGAEAKELGPDLDVARCGCKGVSTVLQRRQRDERDERDAHLPQNEVPQGGPDPNAPGEVLDWRYPPSERFAINNPYLYLSEDRGASHRKYGSMEDIIQDIEDLGAGVARQPHRLQLFLDRFLPVGFTVPYSAPGTVETTLAEAAVSSAVAGSDLLATDGNLVRVIRHLHESGTSLKLLLTLLTLGGGREELDLENPPYAHPLAYPWGDDHIGRSITSEFGERHAFWTGHWHWARSTMEPANGYKRVFYRMFARQVARRLTALRSYLRLTDGLELEDYLLGVEIGNELEIRHTIEIAGRVWGDANAWGDLWFECATTIRDEASWLPIWLPGVSSYGGAEDTENAFRTWEGKTAFLEELLNRVRTRLADSHYRHTYLISDLVAGIDYHYYHRGEGDAQRLAYLIADLRELRGILDFATLQDAIITVMECGVNVACEAPSFATATRFFIDFDHRCEYTESAFPYRHFTQPNPDPSSTEPGDREVAPISWTQVVVVVAARGVYPPQGAGREGGGHGGRLVTCG